MTAIATTTDLRFTVPLYTVTEASRILVVPRATLSTWADGYTRQYEGAAMATTSAPATDARATSSRPSVLTRDYAPMITAFETAQPKGARIPFVGVAEAYALNAFRRAGVPMQRIRPSIDWLVQNVGPHALASKALFTDGAEVLWDFAQASGGDRGTADVVRGLVVPRSGQYVFKDIITHYLRQITFGTDEYAEMIRLPQYGDADVVLDPYRGYGQPIFSRSGAKVADALGPLQAGETFEAVAADYGVTVNELRDAVDAIAA